MSSPVEDADLKQSTMPYWALSRAYFLRIMCWAVLAEVICAFISAARKYERYFLPCIGGGAGGMGQDVAEALHPWCPGVRARTILHNLPGSGSG